ncbi:30S ribosomal protein S10 [Hibiscus syriacus]|uniref:Small ribosomal subunit protein uS10c n=1 Tax=Hibiscus syriacus TaxID=106335 RepID=A0A6A2YJZ0_HIBSY|nr:30S ribosomal protein S10, chloroplastic-like isoform X1 [Hibiscus syriacus]KAE8678047.1 30S ribosomal protein S10 [Hibiscus syriacus]
MAVSSISSTLFPSLTIPNSSSPKPRFSFLSRSSPLYFNPLKLPNCSYRLSQSTTKVFAAPEDLVETPEVGGSEVPASSSVTLEADKVAPKQKIRIKLRSYWVPLIEDSCKQILDAARTTNAKTMGPVPLPTKKRIYCVLKSPHVHKDARFHFEIRTHQRLIDILYPTAQTIDSLMQLDLPAGVDVEVKL